MKKAILTFVVAMTTCAASAFAADVDGTVEIGGRVSAVKGNEAKFNEYRDQRTAATLGFDLGVSEKGYYLELNGKNSGFIAEQHQEFREVKDQSYKLKVGSYDNFKFSLFYDEIPHNITYGAVSLYPAANTGVLSAPVANNATPAVLTAAPKYTLDYGITRRNYGAAGEVSLKSPFFFSVRADRNETNGTLPLGTYAGGIKEIPQPINFMTDNLYLETGYRTRNLVATVDGTISSFHDQSPTLRLSFTNGSQAITEPPSNEYYKVGGSVKYDIPFLKSTLMARGSYSRMSNEMVLTDALITGAGAGINTLFHGNINYTTASAALTSNPLQNLDTRVFVNYLNKKNDSTTGFQYRTGVTTAGTTEAFSYHKINGGIEAGYKLPAKTKVTAGYEYLNLVRNIREDAPQTVDHIAFLQVKNSLLDWMTAKVRYQYLNRESDYRTPIDPAGAEGQATGYFRAADAATKSQQAIKVGLDIEAMHNLAIGIEYAFKQDKYRDSVLGIQGETKHDVYLDANLIAGIFKFNPFLDVELASQDSRHHVGAAAAVPGPSTAAAYNWNNNAKNVYYATGINTEIQVIKDRLTANLNARYEDSNGKETFTTDSPGLAATGLIFNNNALDNYIRKSITAMLTAKFTNQLKGSVGYSVEKLQYLDDHYIGYNNYPLGNNGTALTGAYNNPDYTAHVGFVTLAYSF